MGQNQCCLLHLWEKWRRHGRRSESSRTESSQATWSIRDWMLTSTKNFLAKIPERFSFMPLPSYLRLRGNAYVKEPLKTERVLPQHLRRISLRRFSLPQSRRWNHRYQKEDKGFRWRAWKSRVLTRSWGKSQTWRMLERVDRLVWLSWQKRLEELNQQQRLCLVCLFARRQSSCYDKRRSYCKGCGLISRWSFNQFWDSTNLGQDSLWL